MTPLFSIILAAYNRSRHIVPTITSVLAQSMEDFELIVVGDGCTDDTEAVVRGLVDPRITWRNLPERAGSQSGPNNAGIALARGKYIAYLGHDDLWAPDHLLSLKQCLSEYPEVSFAIAGSLFYGPPGSGTHRVHGLFVDDDAPLRYFLPPSSVAHRRGVTDIIGPWGRAEDLLAAVDVDFILRAHQAGLRFVSSGRITVHKFASGHRYLTYMKQQSDEQALLLRMMAEPAFPEFMAAVVRRAQETGRFMRPDPIDYTKAEPGGIHRGTRINKGLLRPPLRAIGAKTSIKQTAAPLALDWQPLQRNERPLRRWSGPNPRPKFLLPVTARGMVELRFYLFGTSDGALDSLVLRVNGEAVRCHRATHKRNAGVTVLSCAARLREDDYSTVEFDLTGGMALEPLVKEVAGLDRRIALGKVTLRPVGWMSRLRRRLRRT